MSVIKGGSVKKLRLLLFEKCERNCDGCCNELYDLKALPVEENFGQYDVVLLTGGEPMLEPQFVIDTAMEITKQDPMTKIYVYTAKVDDIEATLGVMFATNGLTVTLHGQEDVEPFRVFNDTLLSRSYF